MWDVCVDLDLGQDYRQMAINQDKIGWRRFMEGMVCWRIRNFQSTYADSVGLPCWKKGPLRPTSVVNTPVVQLR